MSSLTLLLSAQQPPDQGTSSTMVVGAAILIILAVVFAARSLKPVYAVLKAAATMGLAGLLAIAALTLLVLSMAG